MLAFAEALGVSTEAFRKEARAEPSEGKQKRGKSRKAPSGPQAEGRGGRHLDKLLLEAAEREFNETLDDYIESRGGRAQSSSHYQMMNR